MSHIFNIATDLDNCIDFCYLDKKFKTNCGKEVSQFYQSFIEVVQENTDKDNIEFYKTVVSELVRISDGFLLCDTDPEIFNLEQDELVNYSQSSAFEIGRKYERCLAITGKKPTIGFFDVGDICNDTQSVQFYFFIGGKEDFVKLCKKLLNIPKIVQLTGVIEK